LFVIEADVRKSPFAATIRSKRRATATQSLTVPMIVVVVVVVSTCRVADDATLLLATSVFSVVVHFLTDEAYFIGNRAT